MIKQGIWYKVTKGSADGAFQEGDQVYLEEDGRLTIRSDRELDIGTRKAEDLMVGSVSMVVDKEWYKGHMRWCKQQISECQRALGME